METLPSSTVRSDRSAVRVPSSGDEVDACPHPFVRGLLAAVGLAIGFWLALAAVVVAAVVVAGVR